MRPTECPGCDKWPCECPLDQRTLREVRDALRALPQWTHTSGHGISDKHLTPSDVFALFDKGGRFQIDD